MILCDDDLRRRLFLGEDGDPAGLTVTPLAEDAVGPGSVDVRLGSSLVTFDRNPTGEIDPLDPGDGLTTEHKIPDQGILIRPGHFILTSTLETVGLPPDLCAQLDGRSTLARYGLEVHRTAGFIDAGFSGKITLEMTNANRLPIRLRVGMPIGQLVVFQMTGPASRPYGSEGVGRYQGQQTATPPRPFLPAQRAENRPTSWAAFGDRGYEV